MSDKQPNILFILIDDMGWRDLSCYGSAFYETPNIDRLAAEGMMFTDAYAACPVCSPTRASVITGQYPARVGITDWIDWWGNFHPLRGKLIDVPYLKQLPEDAPSFARVLQAGGYATWHVGKWHLGGPGHSPLDYGFDVNVGGCHQGSPGEGGYFSPWSIEALKDAAVPEGTYLTDYLTDRAVDLIAAQGEQPFFLNMWYYSVHTPIEAKADKIARYEAKAQAMGLDTVEPFKDGGPFHTGDKEGMRQQHRQIQSDPVYAAMIESLDEGIGRLLAALEESGKAEDTIVIFTSDNGGLATAEGSPTCNAPLSTGKGWMYEGGTREPLLVRWPGVVEAGSRCAVPVTSPDFYPTFLDCAGLDADRQHARDGMSLRPLLQGATLPSRPIFWHYPHYGNQGGTPGASVRQGDYKLIRFFEDDWLELYNLPADIGEDDNLAPYLPEKTAELEQALGQWQAEVEALIPQPNPEWADS